MLKIGAAETLDRLDTVYPSLNATGKPENDEGSKQV